MNQFPGDYGYYDEQGNIFIIGRANDFIKIAGKPLMFDIVEDAILQMDGMLECCIVGVPSDSVDNEIPVAIVVPEKKGMAEDEILAFLDGKFESQFTISRIFFVEHLIKTITGKIKRNDIRNLAVKMYLDEVVHK